MKKLFMLVPLVLFASACGEEDKSDAKSVSAKSSCADVETILAATSEKPPFSSLRGDNAMLGDRALPDAWVAKSEFFGKPCRVNKMGKFFGGETDFHTFSCQLYEARGSLDKENREIEARKIVDEMKAKLQACLPEGWTSEEKTEDQKFEVYYKIQYEPKDFTSPYSFTADPLYLEMTYTPFMSRSTSSGWNVKLQFQEQVPTEG